MNRGVVFTLLAAVGAGVLGLLAGRALNPMPLSTPTLPTSASTIAIGSLAPDLSWVDRQQQSRALSHWRGRPLLLNFWASWCAPCIEEMPMLDRYAAEQSTRSDGIQVVGIALDDPEAVEAFLVRTPVSYPILLDLPDRHDSSVQLGNALGVLPFTVLIGAEGRILAHRVGSFDADQLRSWIDAAIN
jgi:thiol-disulfide isomerase/thioredoxin